MKKLINWLKTLFLEEYELTVWYKSGTEFDPKTTKRVYRLKSISKKATSWPTRPFCSYTCQALCQALARSETGMRIGFASKSVSSMLQ